MDSQQRKNRIVFIIILVVVSICVGIGYTTAYFTVKMTYDTTQSDNVTIMANVGVTFEDGDTLSLDNALPGDSVTKTFTVTNSSDSTALYSIDFSRGTNSFINNEIVYSLYEIVDNEDIELFGETTLPCPTTSSSLGTVFFVIRGFSIVDCTSIEKNTSKTYKLVLTFKETNTDQSYNMGKSASVTIGFTGLSGTKCSINISNLLSTTTTSDEGVLTTSLDGTVVDETDDQNIRYVGENPNNYIWFNCYDYNDTSTCERWRIIGVMNNVSTAENGTQSLIKIIRADQLTDTSGNSSIYWDYTTTGEYYDIWDNTELKTNTSTTRTEGGATLRRILNDAYYGSETVYTGIYSSSGSTGTRTYTYSKDSSDTSLPRGITSETLNIIEKVNWNVTPATYDLTALTMYNKTGTTWSGFIGLMDPSDYGYATSGGDTGRSTCLGYTLDNWNSYSECYKNSWIRYYNPTDSAPKGSVSSLQWTIRPFSSGYHDAALDVRNNGTVGSSNVTNYNIVDSPHSVRPALFLKSSVKILGYDDADGTYSHPYLVEGKQELLSLLG